MKGRPYITLQHGKRENEFVCHMRINHLIMLAHQIDGHNNIEEKKYLCVGGTDAHSTGRSLDKRNPSFL